MIDKSLVITDASAEEPRFCMLETIRQFTHDRLAESGEMERVKTSHLGYYLQFAETANQNLFSAAQSIYLSRLDLEYPNLRAALAWAEANHQTEIEMRLAVALGYFWYIRLYMDEISIWLERALKAHTNGCLIGFAGLIAGMGNPACALRILGAVDAAMKIYGGQLDSPDRIVYECIMVEVNAQLDDTEFTVLWSEGQQLTIEQAIELAISGIN